jgi:hypothetical protein
MIAGWEGGEGDLPEELSNLIGKYIGPSGLVDDPGDATNIRGPAPEVVYPFHDSDPIEDEERPIILFPLSPLGLINGVLDTGAGSCTLIFHPQGPGIIDEDYDPEPEDGENGEYWFNYETHEFFGPKTGGVWPEGQSLAIALDGRTYFEFDPPIFIPAYDVGEGDSTGLLYTVEDLDTADIRGSLLLRG